MQHSVVLWRLPPAVATVAAAAVAINGFIIHNYLDDDKEDDYINDGDNDDDGVDENDYYRWYSNIPVYNNLLLRLCFRCCGSFVISLHR